MKRNSSRWTVGTAGWSIPKTAIDLFPSEGSHLERYSQTLTCVEINSSFYRDHKPQTYSRWARETPDSFVFSVKLSRFFTHQSKLLITDDRLTHVVDGIKHLGSKLSVLLVQLPPKLEFLPDRATPFFSALREAYNGAIALEPRHKSWISEEAISLLNDYSISKVEADPDPCPLTSHKVKSSLKYYRLHGSPEVYKSNYTPEFIDRIASEITGSKHREVWCIFDNTTFGHATHNACALQTALLAAREEKRMVGRA